MPDKYTDDELNEFEIITDDLILALFETKDKRYWITKMLKKAFDIGKFAKERRGEHDK